MFGGVLLAATARNEPSWWQRGFQKVAATPPFAWLLPYVLPKVDPFLLRVSDGDVSIPQVFTGLPVILLTTTGAKSGKERTNPVMGIQQEDGWVLIASNWGKDRHPAWYYNLRENPRVKITDDETREYVAETVTGEKREEYWKMAADLYVGFDAYEKRSGERKIPVVELTLVEETAGSRSDESDGSESEEVDESGSEEVDESESEEVGESESEEVGESGSEEVDESGSEEVDESESEEVGESESEEVGESGSGESEESGTEESDEE